ncbi:hypothetical protein HDU91_000881 [Kappamyces sp. JEL0680]|nr:hypothetical protein HDU91_000881 [Kappamyces sp. JEL0680]
MQGMNPNVALPQAPPGQSRTNSIGTFSNTRHAAFNERVHFEMAFNNYASRQGYPNPPVISGRPLDVFVAFHSVWQVGGFDEANKGTMGGWSRVCHNLGIEQTPQNFSILNNYYGLALLAMEKSVKKDLATANSIERKPTPVGGPVFQDRKTSVMSSAAGSASPGVPSRAAAQSPAPPVLIASPPQMPEAPLSLPGVSPVATETKAPSIYSEMPADAGVASLPPAIEDQPIEPDLLLDIKELKEEPEGMLIEAIPEHDAPLTDTPAPVSTPPTVGFSLPVSSQPTSASVVETTSVKEEEVEEEGLVRPKVRIVQTFGGYDLATPANLAARMRPTKECYRKTLAANGRS